MNLTSTEKDALLRKRKYPAIDSLIEDEKLIENVRRFETDDQDVLLTLGTALLRDHHPSPLPAGRLIRSLEDNLSAFVPSLDEDEKKVLAAELLNGRIQFLNTLSELGLARYYLDDTWNTSLAVRIPGVLKNVDIYLEKESESRWLDVINAEPKEWEYAGFAPMAPADLEMRLVDKIERKFASKFKEAVDNGWKGDAWIGLDFTKNDSITKAVTLMRIIGSRTLDEFASEIFRRCPELKGIVYFTYYASEIKAHWVREFPNL
ncbi:hypothetical protein K8T06_01035 [bacterium]|nr:hypothetical protein [bacterium]